jgi:hypothetical protein
MEGLCTISVEETVFVTAGSLGGSGSNTMEGLCKGKNVFSSSIWILKG